MTFIAFASVASASAWGNDTDDSPSRPRPKSLAANHHDQASEQSRHISIIKNFDIVEPANSQTARAHGFFTHQGGAPSQDSGNRHRMLLASTRRYTEKRAPAALRSCPASGVEAIAINIPFVTRRESFAISAAALASVLIPIAKAVESPERHGISAFGDLKYPADFNQFDYVNPKAPKGGVLSQIASTRLFNQGVLTFNSLNSFILKGDAAQGMEFTFASLMARAYDEPDAMYGLAARGAQISSDRLTYRFFLRPGITFHDGSPLTAHDVLFSLQVLKEKGHPIIQQMLKNFAGAQAPDRTPGPLGSARR